MTNEDLQSKLLKIRGAAIKPVLLTYPAIAPLDELIAALAARGVSICMEPLTAKETNFILTCADAQELIERVDHPHFVLHQDVKAMLGSETKTIPELIAQYQGRVGHFHVNDTNLLGPGMGDTDYRPIINALIKAKYDGWVSVEVFDYKPGAEHIVRVSIKYMQRILRELEEA